MNGAYEEILCGVRSLSPSIYTKIKYINIYYIAYSSIYFTSHIHLSVLCICCLLAYTLICTIYNWFIVVFDKRKKKNYPLHNCKSKARGNNEKRNNSKKIKDEEKYVYDVYIHTCIVYVSAYIWMYRELKSKVRYDEWAYDDGDNDDNTPVAQQDCFQRRQILCRHYRHRCRFNNL